MITEQEAREAARIYEECSRKFFAGELFGIKSHDDYGRSGTTLIEFANQELARREAERAERAKPIDAEWCLANGAEKVGDSETFRWKFGMLRVDWDERNGVTIDTSNGNWTFLPSVKTSGDFGDLLKVLKGGEP